MKKLFLVFLFSILMVIFLGCNHTIGVNIPKLKEDISRVDTAGTYNLSFDEFVKLLKEIEPDKNIEADEKVREFKQEGKIRDYYKRIMFNSHEIRGYFIEEKLTSVAVYSRFGISKTLDKSKEFETTLEIDTAILNGFKRQVLIINNILNSSNTKKEMINFLNDNIKKEIRVNQSGKVGNSIVYMYRENNSIVIEFIPQ